MRTPRLLLTALAAAAAGCSTGKDRLEAAGARVVETQVNQRGRIVNARNVFVPAEASLEDVLDVAASAENVYSVTVEDQPVDCAAIRRIAALPELRGVSLVNTDTPAECLPEFSDLPYLTLFAADRQPYTTEDLRWLLRVRGLSTISAAGTRVDDGFAEVLRQHVGLERIFVSNTPVGDAFVLAIASRPNLKQIALDDTAVTPQGLLPLAENRSIERVHAAHLKPADVEEYLDAATGLKEIVLDVTDAEAKQATLRNENGVKVLTPEAGGTSR